jgi:hypothetical protein
MLLKNEEKKKERKWWAYAPYLFLQHCESFSSLESRNQPIQSASPFDTVAMTSTSMNIALALFYLYYDIDVDYYSTFLVLRRWPAEQMHVHV